MNDADSQSKAQNDPSPGESWSVPKWLVSTLAGTVVLAVLSGSATPRVRLLFLAPLAVGGFTAAGSIWLLIKFNLNHEMQNWMVGWITLLAIGVTLGSTYLAWKSWQSDLKTERIAFMKQITKMAENAEDPKTVQQERRKMMLAFQARTSFTSYLSYRLEGFSKQLGRNNVWAPPVPELIFLGEQFLSGVAALFLSLTAYHGKGDLFNEEPSA
jgi:hypothetical protein